MPASSQTSPTSLMRSTALAALLAADRHAVDPRAAQLLELVEPRDGALLELRARADHVQVPARARIERQRQPVVAAARDVPVAHVAQPVVHALAHVLAASTRPSRSRRASAAADLVDGDEPVVGDAEDERRVAAPADRDSGARCRPASTSMPRSLERADDLRRPTSTVDRPCSQPYVVVEAPRLVDRRRARAGRARARARSPRRRSPARCGRCRCPRRARPRPTG